MSMKVLSIGLAVMDIAARPVSRDVEWQEKQSISEVGIQLGGDAVNQGVFLQMLGMDPGLVICIGCDNTGVMLKSVLEQKGVNTSYVRMRDDARTGTSLVLIDSGGERRIFSASGAERMLMMEDLPDPVPEGVEAITIASLFGLDNLERSGLDEYLLRARKQGVLVFADAVYDKYGIGLNGIRHLLPQIDYFLPSSYEAETLTGSGTPEESAAKLKELGSANVIIKCGAQGVFADTEEYRGWIPAHKVDPVDTTGAGDCFVATFITGIVKGYPVKEAISFACGAASYSTLSLGASTAQLSWEKVLSLSKQSGGWNI